MIDLLESDIVCKDLLQQLVNRQRNKNYQRSDRRVFFRQDIYFCNLFLGRMLFQRDGMAGNMVWYSRKDQRVNNVPTMAMTAGKRVGIQEDDRKDS